MAKEKVLWAWLRRGVKGLPGNDMERVENGVSNGTPDVDGCYNGGAYKIELKRVPARKNGSVKTTFQPMQIPWLERRWKAGGNSWVLLAVGEGHSVKRYLIRGCDASTLIDCSEDVLEDISVVASNATPEQVIKTASGKSFG